MPNVISIGDNAFFGCDSIKSLFMREVTSVGTQSFCNCGSLENVTMPKVVTIGDSAFSGCLSLESVTMTNVISIGDGAFADCDALVNIDVGTNNEHYVTEDGNLFNKNMTKLIVYLRGKKETSYTVPESVTDIDNGAFSNSVALKHVTMLNVRNIGEYAFSGCESLKSVYISKSLSYIGYCAFQFCGLCDVYYEGEENDKSGIYINDTFYGNELFKDAEWHYNYVFDGSEILEPVGDYIGKIEATVKKNSDNTVVTVTVMDASVDKNKIWCFAASADGSAAKKLKGVISGSEVVFETDDKDAKIFIWDENMRPMTEAY